MPDSLFLLSGDGSLQTMSPTPFVSEDEFQALLERHPELLTDADFGEGEPRRWMLVKRESGVPDSEGGSGRWSLDHLFLDQDGVPTLIEIKRATDTRARREVVAQMLDYAANAVSWWRVEDLVGWFQEACVKAGRDPVQVLEELLQSVGTDAESYWRRVEANLGSGRIRMIFVADAIAPELQRIVEFLNEQMKPAVVAAVELKPFATGDKRLLAPRLIGFTSKAGTAKRVVSNGDPGHTQYWAEFDAVAAQFGVRRSTNPPRGPNYYSNLPDTKSISLVGFVAPSNNRVGAYLGIWRPDARLIRDRLESQMPEISAELRRPVQILTRSEQTVWVRLGELSADARDEADWPRQHRFIAEAMSEGRMVLAPRLSALAPS